jgi:hypothetical protein
MRALGAALLLCAMSAVRAHAAAPVAGIASIVRVESGADVLAAGFVLESDHKILTSLSALGGRKEAQVRYITGQVSLSSVVLTDPARDLALLDPAIKMPLGLKPATGLPMSLRTLARGKRELITVSMRGLVSVTAAPGATAITALDLSSGEDAIAPGAPLLDEQGNVAAMAISACSAADDPTCSPRTVGLGVAEIRQALKRTLVALPQLPVASPAMTLERAGKTLPIQGLRVVVVPQWLTPYGVLAEDVIFAAGAETVVDARRLEAIVKDTSGRAGLLMFRAGRLHRLNGLGGARPVRSLPLEREVVAVYGRRIETDTVAAVRVAYTRPLARSAAGIQSGDLLLVLDEQPALVGLTGSRALVLRHGRLMELRLRRRVQVELAP